MRSELVSKRCAGARCHRRRRWRAAAGSRSKTGRAMLGSTHGESTICAVPEPSLDPSVAASAVRIDPGTGDREEASYLGASQVLGITHIPKEAPGAGVLICSSLHADFLGNYRKEVLLARALCRRGLAVQRFQYRGTGNSGGKPEDVTFETLAEDAGTSLEHLRQRCGLDQVGCFGTRMGALVAANQAGDVPLALWEPVLEARAYFREAFRARLMRQLKEQPTDGSAPASTQGMLDELRQSGSVDVLGYTIHRPLHDSCTDLTLAHQLDGRRGPRLLVQISKSPTLRGDYAAVAAAWESAGVAVDARVIAEDEAWWFVGDDWQAEEERTGTATLIATTTDWFAASFSSVDARS